MARYNTTVQIAGSISAGTTLSTPGQGIFNEITTGGITVQIASPVLYSGTYQIFYNSALTSVTLSTITNGGQITGPGITATSNYTLGATSSIELWSDGANWIAISGVGGPVIATTLSASGTVSGTGFSTYLTTPPAIGSSTPNSGAFTTLSASQTVGLSPAGYVVTISPTGAAGQVVISSPTANSSAGSMDNVAIGATTAQTSRFTTTTITNSTGTTVTVSSNAQGSTAASGNAVQVTGGLGVGGTIYTVGLVETSSIAFKENVNPITGALDAILKLTGVTYDRTDNYKHEAGLIAEEVYKHAPDLVAVDKDGKPYGIHYTKISAYLIECIKSLQSEINELKGK
jgi:hypothetical protein